MGRNLANLPHPPRTLLGGNLRQLRQDRLGFFEHVREFGDYVPLRFGPRHVVQINDPPAIEELLVTKNKSFRKHFALRMTPVLLGNGLLTSDGSFWLRQRRMAQPAFVPQKISEYGSDFVQLAVRLISEWSDGERRDICQEMMTLTLRIATKVLFSSEISGRERDVGQAIMTAQHFFLQRFNNLVRLPVWFPTPGNLKFRGMIRDLDEIIYGMIRKRRSESHPREDLLSILLHARDEDNQSQMTDRQLRDELMTLFLAGHETTALMLSWAWLALSQSPEILEKLTSEIDLELTSRLPTPADLPKLTYLDNFLHEVLRLYPSAYLIGREAVEPCEIGGFEIPSGMTVWACQWCMHRDPRYWDDPLEFRPERWVDNPPSKQPRLIYFPFGAGPRVCIGNSFAMMEAGLILATLLQRVRVNTLPGTVVRPTAAFTLRPSGPIPFSVEKRPLKDLPVDVP